MAWWFGLRPHLPHCYLQRRYSSSCHHTNACNLPPLTPAHYTARHTLCGSFGSVVVGSVGAGGTVVGSPAYSGQHTAHTTYIHTLLPLPPRLLLHPRLQPPCRPRPPPHCAPLPPHLPPSPFICRLLYLSVYLAFYYCAFCFSFLPLPLCFTYLFYLAFIHCLPTVFPLVQHCLCYHRHFTLFCRFPGT